MGFSEKVLPCACATARPVFSTYSVPHLALNRFRTPLERMTEKEYYTAISVCLHREGSEFNYPLKSGPADAEEPRDPPGSLESWRRRVDASYADRNCSTYSVDLGSSVETRHVTWSGKDVVTRTFSKLLAPGDCQLLTSSTRNPSAYAGATGSHGLWTECSASIAAFRSHCSPWCRGFRLSLRLNPPAFVARFVSNPRLTSCGRTSEGDFLPSETCIIWSSRAVFCGTGRYVPFVHLQLNDSVDQSALTVYSTSPYPRGRDWALVFRENQFNGNYRQWAQPT